ncbi:hypothetical protein TSUD_293020 [Trifolium subterraneum]|uniref:Uncharacterized protein n=1 Tax=Trifolium subterraneum TaxID=3900 RepID=A0A2Z6NMN7_TRISU|nr:hypothetical protein TSUD_293020 [Trifolium subterraneum]
MAQDSSFFLNKVCSSNITTTNSNFHANLMILLNSLSSKAIDNTEFYDPIIGINPSDSAMQLNIYPQSVLCPYKLRFGTTSARLNTLTILSIPSLI